MRNLIEIGKVAPPKRVTLTLTEKEAHYVAVKLDEETMLFRYRVNMLAGQNPPPGLLEHWRESSALAEAVIDKIAAADG
jgi:hypothetical protein